jgi:non-heme chloroperoxidase
MPTITTSDGTEIFYKDWGSGEPIVFSHGWPLSADDWDAHMLFFLEHGYRVIAHDRRGHGRSTQTGGGHDMDHYADDLAALLTIWISGTPSTSDTPQEAAKSSATSADTARTACPGRC